MVSPKLIFTQSYETDLHPKEIELYWGNLSELVTENDYVLISSTIFHGPKSPKKNHNLGGAWANLKERFHLSDDLKFKVLFESSQDSVIWPIGNIASNLMNQYEDVPSPYLSSLNTLEIPQAPRQIFCLHTCPHPKVDPDQKYQIEYENMIEACPLGIKLWELKNLNHLTKLVRNPALVMSTLSARQIRGDQKQLAHLMKTLLETTSEWFKILPNLSVIRICFWDKDIQKKIDQIDQEYLKDQEYINEIRMILKERLNLNQSPMLTTNRYQEMIEALREKISNILQSQTISTAIMQDLLNLELTLNRSDLTITELGTSAGRLTESMVGDLCHHFYGKWNNNFFDGIEKLTTDSPTQHPYQNIKLSKWYNSYLHTIRSLRNESAHAQNQVQNIFPKKLDFGDSLILLCSLFRVLELYTELIDKVGFNQR